jgi:hypothetical protein
MTDSSIISSYYPKRKLPETYDLWSLYQDTENSHPLQKLDVIAYSKSVA